MTEESRLSFKGEFLIAMPGLNDPNFSNAVICVCEHTSMGSVGIVINRTYPSLFAKTIFDELKIETSEKFASIPVYFGGPVHMNEIFVLHGPPFDWEGCMEFSPTLALSNTRDILEAVASGKGPKDYILALGCSGWGPDQLEDEIKKNVWLSCPASEEILFHLPLSARWEQAVRNMGIDPALLSDAAGHA